LPTAIDSGSHPLKYESTLYTGASGTGGLYGSDAQGLAGVFADSGSSRHGIFAAHRMASPNPISGSSVTYDGMGCGVKVADGSSPSGVLISIPTVQVTPNFSTHSLTASLTLDSGHILTEYSSALTYASDMETCFAEITSISGGLDFEPGTSFIQTLRLPKIYEKASGTVVVPSMCQWGCWNAQELSPSAISYPGLHNFWVAGEITVPGAGASTKAKLAVPTEYSTYRGLALQTVIDPAQALLVDTKMRFGSGWKVPSIYPIEHSCGTPVDSSTFTGSFVSSQVGTTDIACDWTGRKFHSITTFPDHSVILTRSSGAGDIDETRFNGDVLYIGPPGTNVTSTSLARTLWDASGALNGLYVGAGVNALIMSFEREVSGGSIDGSTFGVAIAHRTRGYDTAVDEEFEGWMHGAWYPSGSSAIVMSTPDLKLTIVGQQDNIRIDSIDIDINGGTETLQQDGLLDDRVYIDKDAFFTRWKILTGLGAGGAATLASNIPAKIFDKENSWLSALPGIEEFDHVGWGQWLGWASDNSGHVRGYFGHGRVATDGTPDLVPDYSALAVSVNPVINYVGRTIAVLLDSDGERRIHGTANIAVNFSSTAVTGTLNYPSNANIALSGNFNAGTHTLSGTTTLDGGGSGDFKAGFYNDETAGSFGAVNGTKSVYGAFGAKANTSIPTTSR
ncbi:MAG: hypothetical protein KDK78_05895, partial [Chlamydiia bacterium]|nr:hypothetical protein [Chlamydiia bacterium]